MKKTLISLIAFCIVLVMILAAFVGPWYVINFSSPNENIKAEANVYVYLTRTKIEGEIPEINLEGETFADYSDGANFKTIADNVKNMVLGAIIAIIAGLVFLLLSMLSASRPNSFRMLGFCFGILTFIIALISVIYFMSVAVEEGASFWDNQTTFLLDEEYNVSMGPGYAWYVMLISAAISVVSSGLLLKEEKTEILKTEE